MLFSTFLGIEYLYRPGPDFWAEAVYFEDVLIFSSRPGGVLAVLFLSEK